MVGVVQDDLTPVFRRVEEADAIILSSPIYFVNVSGELKSFMERLMFPYLTYTDPPRSLFPRKIKTGFVYTMNTTEEQMKERGYLQLFTHHEMVLKMIFGSSVYICSCDTYQFEDYSAAAEDISYRLPTSICNGSKICQ